MAPLKVALGDRLERAASAPSGEERFQSVDELERLGAALRTAETVGLDWEPDPEKKVKHAPKAENRRVVISPYSAAAQRHRGAPARNPPSPVGACGPRPRPAAAPRQQNRPQDSHFERPCPIHPGRVPRLGAFVIAGESSGTKDEKPRADLKRPWADRGLVLHLSHGAKQLTASGLRKRRSCD
jgi:hypothetical protein